MNRTILQQILDALENSCPIVHRKDLDEALLDAGWERNKEAIKVLKAELAKPDPTPTWYHCIGSHGEHRFYDNVEEQPEGCTPLYAAPIESNCRFPICHSQEYQDKLADEITKEQL